MTTPDPQPTEQPGPPPAPDPAAATDRVAPPTDQGHRLSDDELVDEIGRESFPASDPPATY